MNTSAIIVANCSCNIAVVVDVATRIRLQLPYCCCGRCCNPHQTPTTTTYIATPAIAVNTIQSQFATLLAIAKLCFPKYDTPLALVFHFVSLVHDYQSSSYLSNVKLNYISITAIIRSAYATSQKKKSVGTI